MSCCDRPAAFTYRHSTETEVEVIGGSDKYVSLCRGCYNDQSGADFKTTARLTPKKRVYPEMPSPDKRMAKQSRTDIVQTLA